MHASMSVRHNTSASGTPYVLANGYVNRPVSFAGRDSDNEYFSCYVLTSSSLYAAAVEVKNNFNNGGKLEIFKQQNSGQCEKFSLGNYSYLLD